MAINLLDMLKGQMGSSVTRQIGNYLGESESATSGALDSILPTVLGSVIQKGSTDAGAGELLKSINDGGHDGSIFDNLSGVLGGGEATSGLMKTGSSLLGGLMGNSMMGSVLDLITKSTGFGRKSSSSLMSMVTPLIYGMIGRYVKNKALDAIGLRNFLGGQRTHAASALPSGMASLLGFGADTEKTVRAASTSTRETATRTASTAKATTERAASTATREVETSSGGSGIMKWALPLLLILGGLWAWNSGMFSSAADKTGEAVGSVTEGAKNMTSNAAGAVADGARSVGNAAGNAASTVGGAVKGAAGTVTDAAGNVLEGTVDAAGNLVDGSGKVLKKAGEFTVNTANAAGNAVADAAGNVAAGAKNAGGKMVDGAKNVGGKIADGAKNAGGKIADGAKKAGGAVKGAAQETGAALKAATSKVSAKFTDVFKKKQSGYTYTLNDIVWAENGNRITNYRKSEVEGLAAALKSNPDAKIVVNASTKPRAKVVEQMLTTLGVKANQISSAKGGNGVTIKVQ